MGTQDDAVIRLKLDASQARAEFAKFLADAKGATVNLGASGGRGPGVPGSPGGGIVNSVLGLGAGGLGLGALGGMFAAPGIADALGGINGYLGGFGRNLAESAGLGAFNRNSKVREKAEDKVVDLLGMAGASASDAQIKSLYGIEKGLETLRTNSENRVRALIGGVETKDAMTRAADALDKILELITGKSLSDAFASSIGNIVSGHAGLGKSK